MSLIEQSAHELHRLVGAGQISAVDVATAFCDRIEQSEPALQALLSFDRAAALQQAQAIDRKRSAGEPIGKLAGVPVVLKDVLCTRGERTTCGSRILQNFVPPYDAHVVSRLRGEDAILIAKANMDEFAMGSSTENSAFQVTRNPWALDHVPGGSSGGSAAAVAARQAPLALGTDTGGSIRQPASFCGIVGLKPTYGRVSRYGLVAYASSLDQIGPMARTVGDVALLLEVIAGRDDRDSTSADRPVPSYTATHHLPLEGLRIGLAMEHFAEGLDPEIESAVRSAVKALTEQGASVRDVSLPNTRHSVATYYLVATAEASSNLARYDGVHYGWRAEKFRDMVDLYSATRGAGFGAEVKRRIMLGTFALSAGYRDAYYSKALQVRRLVKQDFDNVFGQVDVLCGPVTPGPAFRIGEKTDNPLEMYLSDIYTIGANLAGIPALSIPCGFTSTGLPIGMQIQAPPFEEERLLRAGQMLQSRTDFHTRLPRLG